MKKFYAFLAAALMSVSVFAAKDVVPSNAVLADYYDQGQVCVCIYVPADLKCYDIVFVGTYNDWTANADACEKFEPVEGYDGWYVVAVDDDGLDGDGNPYESLQGKPIQLDVNGGCSWDYQIGAATWVSGSVTIVAGSVAGEIDLKTYGTDAPNVYTVDAWKKDPCSAVYNTYTIAVINDGCDGFAIPFITGGFCNWEGFQQMQVDQAKTIEYGAGYYYYTFRAAAGTEYQITSGMMDETGTIVKQPAWSDESYLQENIEGVWLRINGGSNFVLGEQSEVVVYDLREENLRWARCAPQEDPEFVVFRIMLPEENKPEAIEIIGTFDDWQGTAMEFVSPEGGMPHYIAKFEARPSQFFKFRSAGLWPNEGGSELELYNAENDVWETIKDNQFIFSQLWEDDVEKGQPCKSINLDWSNPDNYRWSAAQQGIENIVLTEKAQKVVVDGVIYIVRDNKMFNLQGAQVR